MSAREGIGDGVEIESEIQQFIANSALLPPNIAVAPLIHSDQALLLLLYRLTDTKIFSVLLSLMIFPNFLNPLLSQYDSNATHTHAITKLEKTHSQS